MTTEECFLEHRNYIYKKALSFYNPAYEVEDVVAQAYLLFCKAYKTYDASKGFAFITYLSYTITNGIRQYFRDKNTLYYELLTNDSKNNNFEHVDEIDMIADSVDHFSDIYDNDFIDSYIATIKSNKRIKMSERNELILRLYLKGYKMVDIAKMFGVSHQRIDQIIKGYVNEKYYNQYTNGIVQPR